MNCIQWLHIFLFATTVRLIDIDITGLLTPPDFPGRDSRFSVSSPGSHPETTFSGIMSRIINRRIWVFVIIFYLLLVSTWLVNVDCL